MQFLVSTPNWWFWTSQNLTEKWLSIEQNRSKFRFLGFFGNFEVVLTISEKKNFLTIFRIFFSAHIRFFEIFDVHFLKSGTLKISKKRIWAEKKIRKIVKNFFFSEMARTTSKLPKKPKNRNLGRFCSIYSHFSAKFWDVQNHQFGMESRSGIVKCQKNEYRLKKKNRYCEKKFFFQKWPQLVQSYQKSPKIDIWTDFGRFTAIFRLNFEMAKITDFGLCFWTYPLGGVWGRFGRGRFGRHISENFENFPKSIKQCVITPMIEFETF